MFEGGSIIVLAQVLRKGPWR